MKKIIYSAFCIAALSAAGCSDFLETSSPSVKDKNFVYQDISRYSAIMDGAYETWRGAANSHVFGAGLFYAGDVGSDIERHPEKYTAQVARHVPESFYVNGTETATYDTDSYQAETGYAYTVTFQAIAKANAVINAIEGAENFEEVINPANGVTAVSQMYGEAIAMRATCYRELLRFYGDIPFVIEFGYPGDGLVSRDAIYDYILDDLVRVEPVMYHVGEGGITKNRMSRTYVQGLIGRIALDAGGYQTRRSDMEYVDGDGKALTFETIGQPNANADNAFYGRRSDWKTKYQLAQKYFKMCIDSGKVVLKTYDPRSDSEGRTYGNPYQYFFQQLHMGDQVYADESIYEYAMTFAIDSNERPYSSGRPSAAGNRSEKDGYPCKAYGQFRINPAFYYGMFDPNDMRRDVSITVTGSDGTKGTEKLIPLAPGSQANGGGISLNKFDECRQELPCAKQRNSGINGPYMRIAEMYLGYAEASAALGEVDKAIEYVTPIRERAFPQGKADVAGFFGKYSDKVEAVVDERGFEYAGEGDRRWTLIRSGLIGKKLTEIKELTAKMMDGLKSGSYTFDNGNVISEYVYTKLVDAKSEYGYRLTAQTPEGKENDPVLYPGWRGTHDDWDAVAADGKYAFTAATESNLAIQGLFQPVDGAALEKDGYTKQEWGKALLDNRDEYDLYLFYQYDGKSAPVYLWPFTPNTCVTENLHNGYGFQDK